MNQLFDFKYNRNKIRLIEFQKKIHDIYTNRGCRRSCTIKVNCEFGTTLSGSSSSAQSPDEEQGTDRSKSISPVGEHVLCQARELILSNILLQRSVSMSH